MKPLCIFDLETTGVDPAKDRIVSIAIIKVKGIGLGFDPDWVYKQQINPGVPIPKESTEKHGITDADVEFYLSFAEIAPDVEAFISGCDLAGYNCINFDVPLLVEEFYRCEMELRLDGVRIIDACSIFRKKEERTLSAAVKFFCNREMIGAHDAYNDCVATYDVLSAQMQHYPDLKAMNVDQLAEFSKQDDRVDLAGKIVRNKEGVPIYNIGKAKGQPVAGNPSFGNWMLGQDFSQDTKRHLRRLLK